MHPRQHVDLLILLVQYIFQFSNLRFQRTDPFLQRLGVTSREGPSTQLVARLAFEPDVGTLRAARSDSIASYLFTPTPVTGLSDTTLCACADLDHFHGEYAWHRGDGSAM